MNNNSKESCRSYEHIRALVIDLMSGDEQAADQWLGDPLDILEDLTPKQYVATKNPEDVLDLIGRLKHGTFS